MTKLKTLAFSAAIVLAFAVFVTARPALATVYTNGVASGAGAPIAVTTSAAAVICPARIGRYWALIYSTVPLNLAIGTSTGAPAPEPSSSLGIPLPAGQYFGYGDANLSRWSLGGANNSSAEIDGISTNGSGSASCVEFVY